MVEFRGTLYIALQQGVYRLVEGTLIPISFEDAAEKPGPAPLNAPAGEPGLNTATEAQAWFIFRKRKVTHLGWLADSDIYYVLKDHTGLLGKTVSEAMVFSLICEYDIGRVVIRRERP